MLTVCSCMVRLNCFFSPQGEFKNEYEFSRWESIEWQLKYVIYLAILASMGPPPSSALCVCRCISTTKKNYSRDGIHWKKLCATWQDVLKSLLLVSAERSWITCMNMKLIMICLCSHWCSTTLDLHYSQLFLSLACKVSRGSSAMRPRRWDPLLLTSYSQASTWPSIPKANIIVDLVMLLLKITKALIKLGKTDHSVEKKEKRNMCFKSQSWRTNRQFIAKEKNMTACGKQWGLDLMSTVADRAPHNETEGDTFKQTELCLPAKQYCAVIPVLQLIKC